MICAPSATMGVLAPTTQVPRRARSGQSMPFAVNDRKKAGKKASGTRLDCWKEIAVYLGKGERTVKRWEVDRGLPVHRVPGGGRASVYALSSELDEWLDLSSALGLKAAPEEVEEDEPADASSAGVPAVEGFDLARTPPAQAPPGRSRLRRNGWLALGGLLLAGIAGTAVYTAAVRSVGLRLSHALPRLFAKGQPKSDPRVAGAVSDAQKAIAHDLYLKGRYEWSQRTPESLNRALDYFTQSVVHDPGNAQAYVGLADTYNLLREYTIMPENEAYARAIAAARKAVELDDSLAEAHRALAFAVTYGNRDFVEGEKEFRRAIELNPNDPVARLWYANDIGMLGRNRESLEQINKAQELDPSSQAILADKGEILVSAGRKEEGIALLREVERADPEFRSPMPTSLLSPSISGTIQPTWRRAQRRRGL